MFYFIVIVLSDGHSYKLWWPSYVQGKSNIGGAGLMQFSDHHRLKDLEELTKYLVWKL